MSRQNIMGHTSILIREKDMEKFPVKNKNPYVNIGSKKTRRSTRNLNKSKPLNVKRVVKREVNNKRSSTVAPSLSKIQILEKQIQELNNMQFKTFGISTKEVSIYNSKETDRYILRTIPENTKVLLIHPQIEIEDNTIFMMALFIDPVYGEIESAWVPVKSKNEMNFSDFSLY